MFEVTYAGHGHGHIVGIAVVYGLLVTHGASGMYYRSDTGLVGYLHAVCKWEEGIGRHYGTVQVESEGGCFLDGLFQRVYARGLTYSAGT